MCDFSNSLIKSFPKKISQIKNETTVLVPFQAALQLKPPPLKKMLIFVFYFIFKLKFHSKKGLKTIVAAAWSGTSTVAEFNSLNN